MNDLSGIGAFLSPLAFWLFVAIVIEIVLSRRSRGTNLWLSVAFFVVTLFRLFWIAWGSTLRIRDVTGSFDADTIREKMLISIFVFFVTAIFIPAMLMMFRYA